jgi:hypothetical protein
MDLYTDTHDSYYQAHGVFVFSLYRHRLVRFLLIIVDGGRLAAAIRKSK